MSIRVFLVDDHPAFRDGLRVALENADGFRVIGEASSGEEAVATLPTLEPAADVVVMDVRLTGCSGVEATRMIGLSDARPRVLVVTAADDDDIVVGALRAGASGFVEKTASRQLLLWAVQVVAEGGAIFSPQVAGRLSGYFAGVHGFSQRASFPGLTERETQILDLLARGHDNRRIARDLVLAEKTIRNHITNVFTKLNVTDRTAAVVRARDAGLGL